MAEHVDDLTVQYETDGEVTTEELGKQILSKGSWATVVYKYRDRRRDGWTKPKYRICRYQKRNGSYRQQAKFNISSPAQAMALCEALMGWAKEDSEADA